MGNVKKLLISLLAGMVLTGIFLILGQTGLFDTIETTFYDARVLRQVDSKLVQVNAAFAEHQSTLLTDIQEIIYSPAFRRSYDVNQIAEDIAFRRDRITQFAQENPGFVSLRFFDEELARIHYSSRLSDIENRGAAGINYYPVEDIILSTNPEENLDAESLQTIGSWQRLFSG